MVKLHCQKHVVLCDIKKKITISIEQNAPFGLQLEKSLDISLTDENDMYFLFSAKIFGSDYQQLKENQGLLVEYNAFGNMVTDLLTKCLNEENNSSPRYVLQFSETREPHTLQIIETTDFRRLTHLSIELTAASDETLKTYLVNFIKRTKHENDQLVSRLQTSENNLMEQLAHTKKLLSDTESKLCLLETTYKSKIALLEEEHQKELQNGTFSYNKDLESLNNKHALECNRLDEDHKRVVAKLEATVKKQLEELKELRLNNEDTTKILEFNLSSIKDKELELTALKKEHTVLKEQFTSKNDESEQLKVFKEKLSTKCSTLESELETLRTKVVDLESNLVHQKEQTLTFQDEAQRKSRNLEKLEKSVKHQTSEVSKANSIIKRLQKDLKNTQTKAKLRGQVATEQEKILTSRESDLEDLQHAIDELKVKLKEEQECRQQEENKLSQANAALEEAKQTIESNENIISWLNRQISESYSSSLNQRLQASGVPILPSTFAHASTSRPFTTDMVTTTTASPNYQNTHTNGNDSGTKGNLYLLSESSSIRPHIRLSSTVASKPLVSKTFSNTTTASTFDSRTTNNYTKPFVAMAPFQSHYKGRSATDKAEIDYSRHKTGDQKSSSSSVFTDDKGLQSISSSYFPHEKTST